MIVIAVTLSCAGVDTGNAQIAPGQSGSSSLRIVSGEETYRELASFGNCYAQRNRGRALALIATRPESAAEAKTYRAMFRVGNQSCLDGLDELQVSHHLVRGAIAEGLFKQGVVLAPGAVLPAPAAGSIRTLTEAARCYAFAHGERARSLVARTRPGSKDELEAISQLMPEFEQCLPQNTVRRSFDTVLLRYRIAEGLLHLANAPAATAREE